MINQNRDHEDRETRNDIVAGALPANKTLKSDVSMRGERNPFEIGDHARGVTQKVRVASAEPTKTELKPSTAVSAPAPFANGDHCRRETHIRFVPAAARASLTLQPNDMLRGRRSFSQIGGQNSIAIHGGNVPGERSTRNLVKPKIELSSARAFPEIGRHASPETQPSRASEADRHAPRHKFAVTQERCARSA